MAKKYPIEYLPVAQKDLAEIQEYIRKDSPSAAISFLDTLDETVSKLEDFPYMGQHPKDRRLEYLGYRILIVGSYLVFYVVKEDCVEVRRILHGRRKYSFLF